MNGSYVEPEQLTHLVEEACVPRGFKAEARKRICDIA